ncbi:MAG: S8 family peptidase [Bacteroidota bacterium]
MRVADVGGASMEEALRSPEESRPLALSDMLSVRSAFPLRSQRSRQRASDWRDRVFVVAYPDSSALRTAEQRFNREQGVAYVQTNGRYELDHVESVVSDPLDAEPFADSLDVLRVTRTVEAWAVTTGNPSVRIGLLDTGLMLDHPDLEAQVWRNPGEIPDNGVDDDGNGYVDDVHGYDFVDRSVVLGEGDYQEWDADVYEDGPQDHGTLTAGVMSAALDGVGMVGTAPGCPVVVLRAFGRDGTAEDDDLAAALVYAADLGVEVINLSFGRTRSSPLLHEAIKYAYARGTVLVASGGNVGGDAPHYPSDYPEVIGVVWLSNDGLGRASVAQHGPGIALGAPASSVLTTRLPNPDDARPFETQLYSRVGGSSLAAPQVAGAAALLLSIDPTLSPESIRSILTASALDIGAPSWDHETGAGLLDVAAALGRPFPGRIEITSPTMDGGVSDQAVTVTGSALVPDFVSFALDIAEGHENPDGQWERIAGPFEEQVRQTTLGVWNTEGVEEGPYTLRLVVRTRGGSTREVRHRITLDRSPPSIALRYSGVAYVDGRAGLFVDLVADEMVEAELAVEGMNSVVGPEVKEEHGLFVPNTSLQSGQISGVVLVTNAAGLTTEVPISASLPADRRRPSLFELERLSIPSGYLLPRIVDIDGDSLGEVILNQAGEPGALGDTVAVYESGGRPEASLRRVVTYAVPAIPRDVADTNGDGRSELLFQVDPITLLIEASQPGGYPDTEQFRDEEGTTPSGTPLWGARLADLDADGRGEIVGLDLRSPRFQPDADPTESTGWRVLERQGEAFTEVATLDNTTSVSAPLDRNLYQRPYGLTGDFDGNGRIEWLTGDADGDLLLYESVRDDTYDLIWTEETDRYNAGQRLATGDFDGNGRMDFATFTTEFTASDIGSPAYGTLTVWSREPGQAPQQLAQAVFPGDSRTDGSLTSADFDGSSRDELVVQHALQVWVLALDDTGLTAIFHAGPDEMSMGPSGFSSPQMAAGSMEPGALPSLFVSGFDGALYRFRNDQSTVPTPRWVEAVALDEGRVKLAWISDTDSVVVYSSVNGGPFDETTRTNGDALVVPTDVLTTFALASIENGEVGSLSEGRTVRPHAPARLLEASFVQEGLIRLSFSEPIDPATSAGLFRIDQGEVGAVIVEDTRVIIRVEGMPPGRRRLSWEGLRDAEGTPVTDVTVGIDVLATLPLLYIVSSVIRDARQASITFSEVLDVTLASDPARYALAPTGLVTAAIVDEADPRTVHLTVVQRALGAVGEAVTLRVSGLRSTNGAQLAADGAVVTLSEPADNLDDVFVYPNPVRVAQHGEEVVIAGVPIEADVQIYTVSGALVRSLLESGGFGGARWDMRDEQGRTVPSGVYLIRVSTEGLGDAVVKLAVQR